MFGQRAPAEKRIESSAASLSILASKLSFVHCPSNIWELLWYSLVMVFCDRNKCSLKCIVFRKEKFKYYSFIENDSTLSSVWKKKYF